MSVRGNSTNALSLAEALKRLAALESTIAGFVRNRRVEEPIQRACYSVREFCTAHGISDHMFFKLQRQGIAPRTMRVGARTLISVEAAAEWRRQCEAAENPASAQKHTDGEGKRTSWRANAKTGPDQESKWSFDRG